MVPANGVPLKPHDAMFQELESDRVLTAERSVVRLRASICSRRAAIHSTSDPWGRWVWSPQEGQVGLGSESRRPLRLTARRSSSLLRSSTTSFGRCSFIPSLQSNQKRADLTGVHHTSQAVLTDDPLLMSPWHCKDGTSLRQWKCPTHERVRLSITHGRQSSSMPSSEAPWLGSGGAWNLRRARRSGI